MDWPRACWVPGPRLDIGRARDQVLATGHGHTWEAPAPLGTAECCAGLMTQALGRIMAMIQGSVLSPLMNRDV